MKRILDPKLLGLLAALPLAAALVLALAAGPATAEETAAESPGAKAFAAAKCTTCHTVESQGIERTGKMKGPDLSNLGNAHLAPWIQQYLKKEVANAEGKKHGIAFKGTDEELEQLAKWLATLKQE
jgi:cytochrome c553